MMFEIVVFVVIAGVGGFVGGVLGSNKVHEVETRLRADIVALEGRLRASMDAAKKVL
jgi:hypothetical protein